MPTVEELQSALSAEREARIRAEAMLEGYRMAVAEMASGGTPVDSVAEKRRAYDRDRKRKSAKIPVDSGGTPVESAPPSPLLDGPPLSPAPSLPSPLSSPQPLFSSPLTAPTAPVSPEATATEAVDCPAGDTSQPVRPPLTLAFAQPDADVPTQGKPRRERKARAAKPEPAGDPRHAPLVLALVETHREAKGAPYGFAGGKDARAVTELLALADQDPATRGEAAAAEILRRWGIALRWRGFPACTGLLALRDNWNAYVRAQDAAKGGGDRPRLGPATDTPRPALTGDRPRL